MSDELRTPRGVYDFLNRSFNFDYDAAATLENALAPALPSSALEIPWPCGSTVFCNPPYSRPWPWIKQAIAHENGISVLLLPSDTSTAWFADLVPIAELHFIQGRLQFVGTNGRSRWGSLVAVLRPERQPFVRIWKPDAKTRGLKSRARHLLS